MGRSWLCDFVVAFVVVFVVSAVVTFLWSLIFHHSGAVDWGTSARLGIIFGIVLPWIARRSARSDKQD